MKNTSLKFVYTSKVFFNQKFILIILFTCCCAYLHSLKWFFVFNLKIKHIFIIQIERLTLENKKTSKSLEIANEELLKLITEKRDAESKVSI